MRSGTDSLQRFKVTIIETLKRTVEVEADSQAEAEQMVSDGWHSSKYILGTEDFVDVEFEAVPAAIAGSGTDHRSRSYETFG